MSGHTCLGVARLIALGEVAVAEEVRVVEDVILYFFASEGSGHLHVKFTTRL